MTAPTPNTELARRALVEIRLKLVNFNWSNYGLDLVEDAATDWADDLAAEIFAEVAEIFGPRPEPARLGEASCGRCAQPFDPGDTAADGYARYRDTPFCRYCVDRCHESTDAAHQCVICDDVPPNAGSAG